MYDGNGNFVVSSGWMGYADYSGPWGGSLNTITSKTLTFIKANPGSYTLRVSTSTQDYSDAWEATINCSNTGYSGIDLFKAIYFFDGHAAAQIPYFSSIRNIKSQFSSEEENSRQNFISEITTIVQNLSPDFFNRFKQNIYSNNLDAIDAIIDEGAGLLLAAVINSSYGQAYQQANNIGETIDPSLYDFNSVDGINNYLKDFGNAAQSNREVIIPDRQMCLIYAVHIAVAVYWVAAVAQIYAVANAAAIVNVSAIAVAYVAVYATVHFWGPSAGTPTPTIRFEREKLVLDISDHIVTTTN